jgi:hypothetical protein
VFYKFDEFALHENFRSDSFWNRCVFLQEFVRGQSLLQRFEVSSLFHEYVKGSPSIPKRQPKPSMKVHTSTRQRIKETETDVNNLAE